MREVVVRPYRTTDRAAVRRICHLTGFMGEPADWMWRDQRSFADAFSGYYTDREPESASVVEIDGVVMGYLLGCRDSRQAANPAATVAGHIVARGIAFRPGTAPMIWRSLADAAGDVLRGRVRPSDYDFVDERYPAHLHINLLPSARGSGAGRRLVRCWLDQLRAEGSPGCHLQTMAENTGAIAFFETMGFRALGPAIPAPGERTRHGERTHILRMALDLRVPGPG